jgi:hypothetical protein
VGGGFRHLAHTQIDRISEHGILGQECLHFYPFEGVAKVGEFGEILLIP